MQYNISMDICAFFVMCTILFYIFKHRMYQGLSNRVFIMMVINCIIAIIADIMDAVTTSYPYNVNEWVLYATSYIFFIVYNITPFVYAFYVITLTDTQYKILKNSKMRILLFLPLTINAIIILCNPIFNWLFYYDDNRKYLHGDAFIVLFITGIYYLIFGVIYAQMHKNIVSSDKQIAIFSMVLFSPLAVIIQLFFPYQLIALFGESICILLILFTIQKPEEIIDGVMGTWNGSLFLQKISNNFYNSRKFTVCSINIYNYTMLNQSIGFQSVEEVIKDFSRYLRGYETIQREIYYMGSGKFNIIFFGKEEANADKIAYEINETLKKPWIYKEFNLNFNAYVCLVKCPKDIDNKEFLINFTDDFHNKISYTGEVLYKKNIDYTPVGRKKELEHIIERAINEKKFEVYYQPIISVKDRKVKSAEALLRLFDDKYGFISPDEIIPIAEQNGAILKIGMFVIEEVCKFIASANLDKKGIDYIEVNLSVVQCMQTDFAEKFIEIVKKYNLAGRHINLEITETAAIRSWDTMLRNMKVLNEYGINFSLDDYGTGYSNISYAVELPFTIVKLDKSIVCGKNEENKMCIALKNLIRMLKEMEYEIVAEGVETLELVEMLTKYECDYLQGYYFSRPIPESEFLNYILKENTINKC